jgi:hypothetical protein
MPDELLMKVCENWGRYVKELVQEIKRELIRKNAPTEIIYCTEIQEKRYKKYGQVCPHLHLLWYAYEFDVVGNKPVTGKYAITADRLRAFNSMILNRIIGNQGVTYVGRVDVQRVRKSAANYLGKYMSKGGKVVDEIIKDGKQSSLPRTWWGVTKELRKQIVNSIKRVVGDAARNLFYFTEKLEKMGVLSRHGKVTVNRTYYDCNQKTEVSADITYGVYGQLSPKLQRQNDLLVSILDICDKLDDDSIDDISGWISAMANADMVQDVTDFMAVLKQLMLENNDNEVVIDLITGEMIGMIFDDVV